MIKIDLGAVNAELERFSPELIVQWTLELFGRNIIMSSSFGEQSAVMIHMLTSVWPDIPVVVTDTGYFFPETYAFMETLRRRFEINLRIYKSPMTPAEMESEHGKLWEQGADGMAEYNRIRKAEPMERALRELSPEVWLTGRRASQTSDRRNLQIVEKRGDGIYSINPILRWSNEDVCSYMDQHSLPYHPLVAKGYGSIGDWHSTFPGEGRTGRFSGVAETCGLHQGEGRKKTVN